MKHIEFDLNLAEIGKAIGYIFLGSVLVIGILLFMFRNWRPY